MKVLLAHRAPDELADDAWATTLPLGLRFMAARLQADGHEASVANFSRLPWKQVEAYLAAQAPALVGVSCLTYNRHVAVRLARVARRACPGATVILGGAHATVLAETLIARVRDIDAVALGEAEETLAAACRRLAAGNSLAGPGLLVRDAAPQPPVLPPVESLPRPVASLQGAGLVPERDLRHVLASRMRGGGPAKRTTADVVAEIAELRDGFGLLDVSLVGPGLMDAAWLEELADALEEGAGAEWEATAAVADLVHAPRHERLEQALLRAHAAGLRRVRLVLDDDVAASVAPRDLAEASRVLWSAGVAPWLSLRIGGLGQHLGSEWLDSMRGAVRALRPLGGNVERRELLPGTAAWEEVAAEEGLDARWWFDDDRPVVPQCAEPPLERAEAALTTVFREVAREAQPGPRDLDALEARLPGAQAHLDWGDFRATHGDLPEAERRYRLAAQLAPKSPFPWLRLAALFRRGKGSPEQERAALQQVLQLVPRHAGSLARLDELRRPASRARAPGRRRPRKRPPT